MEQNRGLAVRGSRFTGDFQPVNWWKIYFVYIFINICIMLSSRVVAVVKDTYILKNVW